jgi:[amino group carrier protein]-L-2-aminoadipate 6-kinase
VTDIIVLKCGGHAAVNMAAVCQDLARLRAAGEPVVLVHGGSADIDALAGRLGRPARQLHAPDGSTARYTDRAMLEVVQLALAGLVKPRLLALLAQAGVPAVGLTGLDAGLIRARRRAATRAVVDGRQVVIRDNHAGQVTAIRADLLSLVVAHGLVPVVSPPALAPDGQPVNVDADRVAAAVAVAVGARALIFLTGAAGVLAVAGDDSSALASCDVDDAALTAAASGGMTVKISAARQALAGGVPRVVVADGRVPGPVTAALDGAGTTLRNAVLGAGALR